MKKIIIALLAAITLTATSAAAFADSSSVDCKDFINFFDNEEYLQVISQIGEKSSIEAATYSAQNNSDIKSYKMYNTVVVDFIGKLSDGADITTLISPEYSWMIPNQYSIVKVISSDENKWSKIGYKQFSQDLISKGEVQNDTIDIDKVNSAIEELLIENSNEIKDVICVNDPTYFTNFVCIIFADKTYLIPFGSRPDLTGLINGKVYSPNEADDILAQTMDSVYDNIDILGNFQENLNGGAGILTVKTEDKTPTLLIIIIPLATTSAAVVIMMFVWNKLKKNK